MKFLIAGYGSIGRRHFQNLAVLGEEDILFYRTNQSTLPEDDLDQYLVVGDLNEALSHNPDAVIISNPTSQHLEVAIPAVEAGCHLLMEKPLSHSMDKVGNLKAAVENSGIKVLMGFQFRFHPGLIKIKEIIEQGLIGRILSVRAHWGEYLPSWHPWEDYRLSYSANADLGGGVILTLCHPLDYLRWLLGEAQSLWAFSGQLGDLELSVEDSAEIGLRFTNGAIGSLYLSYNQRPTKHYLELVGTDGSIRWDNHTGSVGLYHPSSADWETFDLPRGFNRNDLFLAEMRHFISVLRGEEEPVCTLNDGVRALELALGAKQSSQQGEIVQFRKFSNSIP
jgi:predicted dehydrogenase